MKLRERLERLEETPSKIPVFFHLPLALYERLLQRAKAKEMHPTSYIRAALATYQAIEDGALETKWKCGQAPTALPRRVVLREAWEIVTGDQVRVVGGNVAYVLKSHQDRRYAQDHIQVIAFDRPANQYGDTVLAFDRHRLLAVVVQDDGQP